MRRIVLLFTLLIVSLLPYAAHSQQRMTGMKLLDECQLAIKESNQVPPADWVDVGHCIGYLQGYWSAWQIWSLANKESGGKLRSPACIPDGVTTGEIVRVVVKYLKDHPNKLHEDAGILVFWALSGAYPCSAK